MGIINPYANKPDETGPEVRLLVCKNCQTIEVLDDYTGPQELAELYDTVLNTVLEKHKDGVERREHFGQMFRVKESAWNSPAQEQIRQQIVAAFDPDAETGLGAEAYAIRDNFKEDAYTCWVQHLKTPACSDYKSESKLLTPNTQAERKEAGLAKFDSHNPALQRFLCEYCPVHSLVQQAQRKRAGQYDK
jgi:cation transport regulator ChaB